MLTRRYEPQPRRNNESTFTRHQTFVLMLSGLTVAVFRGLISAEVRIPVFVLIIATIVTLVDMSMKPGCTICTRTWTCSFH